MRGEAGLSGERSIRDRSWSWSCVPDAVCAAAGVSLWAVSRAPHRTCSDVSPHCSILKLARTMPPRSVSSG